MRSAETGIDCEGGNAETGFQPEARGQVRLVESEWRISVKRGNRESRSANLRGYLARESMVVPIRERKWRSDCGSS